MSIEYPRKSKNLPQRPEMFEAWAPRFPNTDPELARSISALVSGYRQVIEHQQKVSRDESSSAGWKVARVAKFTQSTFDPLVEALDKAVVASVERTSILQGKVAAAYNPSGKSMEQLLRGQEIRQHFKTVSLQSKLKLLDEARETDDTETLVAVAGSHRFLSGIPPELHEHTRNFLIERNAPKEAAALSSLKEQQGYAAQFRDVLLQSISDATDIAQGKEILAAALNDSAA